MLKKNSVYTFYLIFFYFHAMTEEIFFNYQNLLKKVDELSSRIIAKYRQHIICRHGCSDCCQQNLTLLPLECAFLQEGFSRLPEPTKKIIHSRTVQNRGEHEPCLLLNQGGCLLYERRPIICRTHGLPLFMREGNQERLDCCPKNFVYQSLEMLPKTDLLHVERLNAILIAVNQVFVSTLGIKSETRLPLTQLLDQ